MGCDDFDGQFFTVIEAKDASANGCKLRDGVLKMFSEFLTFYVSARTGVCLGEVLFLKGVERLCVAEFLPSEVV